MGAGLGDGAGFGPGKDTVAVEQGEIGSLPTDIVEPKMAAGPADGGGELFIQGHIDHLSLILGHIVLKVNRTICPILYWSG